MARVPKKLVEKLAPQPVDTALKELRAPMPAPAVSTDVAEGLQKDLASGRQVDPHRTKDRNINVDNLDTGNDAKVVLDYFSQQSDNAGYAPKTFSDVEEGAKSLDDAKVLKKLIGGKPSGLLSSEEMLLARQGMVRSAENIWAKSKDIAKRYRSGQVSDAEMLDYRRELETHREFQLALQGQQREVARTLGSMRIQAGPAEATMMQDALKNSGGREYIYRQANLVASAPNVTAASRAANKSLLAKTADALIYTRTLGLLSGPTTHMKNLVGNSIVKAFSYPERVLTAGVGKTRQAIARARGVDYDADRAYAGEVMQMVLGDFSSFMDAARASKKAFRSNESSFGQTKLADQQYDDPISSAAFNVDPNSKFGRMLDFTGTAVSMPGRALMGGDEFFKTMAFKRELRTQAFRQSKSEGLAGEKLYKRQQSLMGEMTEDEVLKAFENESDEVIAAQLNSEAQVRKNIIHEAYKSAHYETFTDPLESAVAKGVKDIRTNSRAARVILPFYETLANIMSFAGERSPIAPLFPAFHRNLRAGGVKRDEAIARLGMGVSLATGFTALAGDGRVTGAGPSNYETRKLWEADGWQEYSVRIGDSWVSYKGLEPFTSMLATIADVSDMRTYSEDPRVSANTAIMMPIAMAESIQSQTFLVGVTDFMEALNEGRDNPQKAKKMLDNIGASFVPYSSLARTVRRETDDTIRSTDTEGNWGSWVNRLRSMTPGWSEGLPPQVDVWGRDRKYKDKFGPDFISPWQVNDRVHDTPTLEMIRNGLHLPKPNPNFPINGRKVNLFDVYDKRGAGYAYYEWQKIVGEEKRKAVVATVNTSDYQNNKEYSIPGIPVEGTRGWMIQKNMGKAMDRARSRYMQKYGDQIEVLWHYPKQKYLPATPPGHGEVTF